jgi:hypothetical protein
MPDDEVEADAKDLHAARKALRVEVPRSVLKAIRECGGADCRSRLERGDHLPRQEVSLVVITAPAIRLNTRVVQRVGSAVMIVTTRRDYLQRSSGKAVSLRALKPIEAILRRGIGGDKTVAEVCLHASPLRRPRRLACQARPRLLDLFGEFRLDVPQHAILVLIPSGTHEGRCG